MPKNNKTTKHDGRLFKQKVSATHRIGTRKSGKSAHAMSTEALKDVLTNKSQTRYKNKAIAALRLRGVTPPFWPAKLVEEA